MASPIPFCARARIITYVDPDVALAWARGVASRGNSFSGASRMPDVRRRPMESSPARGLGSVENSQVRSVQANAPKSEKSGPEDP